MKLKALMVVLVLALISLMTGSLYAANGDLIVNGNLGVGTATQQSKLDVNGNVIVSGSVNAGSAIVNGNLAVSGTVTAPNVLAKYYQSPEQDITASGSITLAHGLGAEPALVQVWLVCKSAEVGYSVGDKVPVNFTDTGGVYGIGVSIVPDSTNLKIHYANYGNTIYVIRRDNGAPFGITNAYWKAIFRAWAF